MDDAEQSDWCSKCAALPAAKTNVADEAIIINAHHTVLRLSESSSSSSTTITVPASGPSTMYRPALRAASGVRALPIAFSARRTLSTAPPHKLSRSWKSSFARWGLAGALVYYYNTSSIFADEPACTLLSMTTGRTGWTQS